MKHVVGILVSFVLCYGLWYVAASIVDSSLVEEHAFWLFKVGVAITSFYAYLGDWISKFIFLSNPIRAFVAVVFLLGIGMYGLFFLHRYTGVGSGGR